MIPPIFPVCVESQAVIDLLGSEPLRLYPFGMQNDTVIYPYAVWQNIGGEPENFLNQSPDIDRFSLQVDIYGNTGEEVIAVAMAIRNAIQAKSNITRWGGQTRDPNTNRYRYSFDVDWFVKR